MKLFDLQAEERPRERLKKQGASSLSNAELLAILLRTGRKGESVLTLSQKLLIHFKGLDGLASSEIKEMSSLLGMGETKAITLKAAFELGERLTREHHEERFCLNSPEAVYSLYKDQMRHCDRETLLALHLDTKKRLITEEVVSVGILNSSQVHPREVFRKAIKNGAASLVLIHNHPSGDPTPSPEDIQVTEQLREVGHLIQIPILDHLIIGSASYKRI